MDIAMFLTLLVSLLSPGHPILAKVDNENIYYMKYAYERSVDSGIDTKKFLKLVNCESQFQEDAFNPETESKRKGLTKFSSCGLLQHNDKRCNDKTSKLYDGFYSIDFGIEKIKKSGFSPWQWCGKKSGLLK